MTVADCFTAPSFVTFRHLVAGWVLCVGRHTVTGVLRASGAVGEKHHTSFHRFFRSAVWDLDAVGIALARLVVSLLPDDEPIIVPLDDTLGRHTGKHIKAASMHHDPLLSTRVKPVFHWGHVWVVLSLIVRVPVWDKKFALPVLMRLYRSEKLCKKEQRPFAKKTELAAEMIGALAATFPEWHFQVVADAAYANASIIKKLPSNVDFIGRARLDAALYAPPRAQRMGRPRVKGQRLSSPLARARSALGWQRVRVQVYGRTVIVQVKIFDALWYVVSGGRPLRFVLVRGWPGHDQDDVFCSTDMSLSAKDIIRDYCLRWYIEVTFEETKGKLGFEDPQNRAERAVERTAPMALCVYTLTVVWYVTVGKNLKTARLPSFPWYSKKVPAFSDMLAALRRETWHHEVLDPLPIGHHHQKSLAPMLDALAYAA
jgi:DDE superfamily endonuclease